MQIELRDYLNILRKRWWLILLVALGAAGGGYLYSRAQTPLYQATVSLLVRPSRPDNGLIDFARKNINTYTSGLQSRDFVNRVLTSMRNGGKLDDLTADTVLGRMKVQALPDNLQVNMTIDDTDAQRAADLANALADVYSTEQNGLAQQSQSSDKIFLQQLDTALPPSAPYQPRTALNTAAAALLGLVLGVILAFALELADTTLKTADDVQRYLALTTVGLIPARKP